MPVKILIIDNDRLFLEVLSQALESEGYHVVKAADGLEALEKLKEDPPDVILSDLVMPKLDGARLARYLKEDPRFQHIPLIILTAIAAEDVAKLEDLDADAYIAKRRMDEVIADVLGTIQQLRGEHPKGQVSPVLGLEQLRPGRAVRELLSVKRHLDTVLANLGEGVLELDEDSKVAYANPAALELLGRSELEVVGNQISSVLGLEDWQALLSAFGDRSRGRAVARREQILPHRERILNVMLTDLIEEERFSGTLVMLQDVTPLHRRIEELVTLRGVATVLNSTLELSRVLHLTMEGVTKLMNVEAGSLLLKDEVNGELVFSIVLGEKSEVLKDLRLKSQEGIAGWVAANGEPLLIADVRQDPRFSRQVDELIGFATRSMLSAPLKVKERVIGVIEVINRADGKLFDQGDLSLLVSIANHAAIAIENARFYEQLREASQNKSAFLANMAHELRTPLNSILGFSKLLEDQNVGPLNEKQQRYVQNIWTSGKHLLQLINDILDLSKVEAGRVDLHPERLEVGEVITDAIAMIRGQADKKNLAVEFLPKEALPSLYADPTRFKQILYNLLTNAVKFTPNRGQVHVAAQMVLGSQHRDFVEISVQDTGIGIKAEDLPRLFQPFTQLEVSVARRYEGTGLGLALTKRLVELHGGEIQAESAGEGKGSTFTVTLPLRPPEREQPRLLLVDDDMGLVEALVTALGQAGYNMEVATNGTEALTMLEKKPPNLLLLDLKLPGLGGRDILAALRAREATKGLPVVVFTGVEPFSEAEIRRLGAQEFLTKPFSSTVLLEVVARLLGHERRPPPPL